MIEISRQYLEIKNLENLKDSSYSGNECKIDQIKKPDFQLNKFLYKQIGKDHRWIDRLSWSDKLWLHYLNDKNVDTYILKVKNEVAGYFEKIFHPETNDVEIAYFGVLKDFREKNYGGYLLTNAIKISFQKNIKRVWVHTCSLDHKNALRNYLARGMKIFKEEKIKISA
tara:strand:+ start:817 stop:1323 length:507 start_codon:yes stop_codon:yes gene_type:complete